MFYILVFLLSDFLHANWMSYAAATLTSFFIINFLINDSTFNYLWSISKILFSTATIIDTINPPHNTKMITRALPIAVLGAISPYPTVVRVITVNHIVLDM